MSTPSTSTSPSAPSAPSARSAPSSRSGPVNVYADPSSWLPLDGLAPGFDAARAQPTDALEGRSVALSAGIVYEFASGSVAWSGGEASGVEPGHAAYEAFEVADGLVFAQFLASAGAPGVPPAAVSLVLDLAQGRSLRVTSTVVGAAPGRTAVCQEAEADVILGLPTAGEAPAPTDDLLGRRVLWVYSPDHAYEHVYLTPRLYTWHCLAGPERGLADTDECTVYSVRPGIYLFAWREKVVPCASVTVADHRRPHSLRSHGVLFGLDGSGTETVHFTFGAHGRILSQTVHPAEFDQTRP